MVCEECLARMKYSYCANAFPKQGYVSCVSNGILAHLGEMGKKCSGFCCATTSGLCLIDEQGKSCPSAELTIKQPSLLTCMTPYMGAIPEKISQCNSHFINVDHCQDMLASCDCSNGRSQYQYTCERFYNTDGIKFNDWAVGTCNQITTPGWCKLSRSAIAESYESSMDHVRSTMMDFLKPMGVNQFIPSNQPLKADISKASIGTPVPTFYVSRKQ